MKIRNGLVVIIGSLFGCYQPPNLFESGRYSLAVDKIADCTIEAVSFEEEGRFIVEGKMIARHHPDAPLSGDVRGEILSPEGKLLEKKSSSFTPGPHAKRIHPGARFKLVFDRIPPNGSKVSLTHTLRPFDSTTDSPIR